MEPKKASLPGVSQLIRESLLLYKKNSNSFISLGLVIVVFSLVFQILVTISNTDTAHPSVALILISLVLGIIGWVLQMSLMIGMISTANDADKGIKHTLSETYKNSFGLFFPYLWVSILVGLVVLGATPFLIVPGVILSGYIYLSVYFLILDNKRGLNALSTSFYYIRHNWLAVFWRSLALMLIVMAILLIVIALVFVASLIFDFSILSFARELSETTANSATPFTNQLLGIIFSTVLSFLWLCVFMPISTLYGYLIYKNLKLSRPEPSVDDQGFKKTKHWFTGLSIFGICVPILLGVISVIGIAFVAMKTVKNLSNEAVKNAQNNVKVDGRLLRYSDTMSGISFEYPNSYSITTTLDQRKSDTTLVDVLSSQDYSDKFSEAIWINSYNSSDIAILKLIDSSKNNIIANGYTITGESEVFISGQNARKIESEGNVPSQDGTTRFDVKTITYIINAVDRFITIDYIDEKSEFEKNYPVFIRIIDSFKLN